MHKLMIAVVTLSLCLVAGGCGTATSSQASSPLAGELSYFPNGSPFVAVVATDPNDGAVQNAQALLGAFPLSSLGIAALESQLSSIGLNYQTDIEPLFGNPVAFGVLQLPGAVSLSGSNFLAVWATTSATKLRALIKKLPGLSPAGTLDGASVYHAGSSATFAVDGATLLLGASAADVDSALSRHAHGGGITTTEFASAMGSLPQTSIMQAFGTLTGALSGTNGATARKIPWVAAIRSYAASISAGSGGITAQFRIDTSSGSLTSGELPIGAGTAAPSLAGTLPIAVGVRDPAQILGFIEASLQATDPTSYAQFVKTENTVKSKTGYDLDTFAALLGGNSVIESDTKTTMARADVSDPASAAKQLAALPPVLRDLFPTAKSITREPGGFYVLEQGKGSPLNLGIVGNEFVAGVATPAQFRAFATAPSTPVQNARGSVTFRVSLLDLLKLTLTKAPSSILGAILSSLGNVTGSAGASTTALTGSLSLAVK